MNTDTKGINGVMLNAYPDSIGQKLEDTVALLESESFKDAFSLFYILPTFFNSDLDRGFSIIDYKTNQELVSAQDLAKLQKMGIRLKFDIVLNHLSVASPQFKDMLDKGDESEYKDFFINWNSFWEGKGSMNEEGVIVPDQIYLDKLFMRKSGLPVLKVPFPDGSDRPYWNTFYQKEVFDKIQISEIQAITHKNEEDCLDITTLINTSLENGNIIPDLKGVVSDESLILINKLIRSKRKFLGQMDVNAHSPKVWSYYNEVLATLSGYGCSIVRLDAFAYLHKEVGQSNFFNKPGTWEYLQRINNNAQEQNLLLLPEIHAEYGLHLHDEVANQGYMIYDFFMPGLILHTLEKKNNNALYKWGQEIIDKGFATVNMLGCHDGIPLLDLKGKMVNGIQHEGLLTDEEIEYLMDLIISRGGKVKNLYGADGKKLSYYQVNATYYSALGEDDNKMLAARAIQLFMPGIPQVWYLDIFAGKNNYDAVEKEGKDGHKEINRTNLSVAEIKENLNKSIVKNQLMLLKLRNKHKAFEGNIHFEKDSSDTISISWINDVHKAHLKVNLENYHISLQYADTNGRLILQQFT